MTKYEIDILKKAETLLALIDSCNDEVNQRSFNAMVDVRFIIEWYKHHPSDE